MKNFIIFFMANTGSSAIISHLKQMTKHIEIIGFEPFDLHHMKKKLVGDDLKDIFNMLYNKKIKNTNDIPKIYNNYTKLEFPIFNKRTDISIGLKMRYREWDNIKDIIKDNKVVVFVLIREDVFKWAISLYNGKDNQFNLINKKIDKNPKKKIEIKKFREILMRCHKNIEDQYDMILNLEDNGYFVYPLYYEEYCNNKISFFKNILNCLDFKIGDKELIEFANINNYFKKVHDNDISKFILNYDELKEEFESVYDF